MLRQVVQIPPHVTMLPQLLRMTIRVSSLLVPIVVGCHTETGQLATVYVELVATIPLVKTLVGCRTETTQLVLDVPMPLLRTTLRQRPLTMGLVCFQTSP